MRYSVGFRKDVLEAIAKSMPIKEANRRFNISLSTVKEWCRSCGVEPCIAENGRGHNIYLHGVKERYYLHTIEDLFNGEILAYRISSSPSSRLCINIVEDLINRQGDVFDGAILYNDLESFYISHEYKEVVRSHKIRHSMGRGALCYDSAAMESLNSIIKTEALY